MISPAGGYSPNVTSSTPLRDNAVQPAQSVPVPSPAGTSTFTLDVGLAPRTGAAGAGAAAGAADVANGPSRPNVALLEAMQASRQSSALLSSLLNPGGSFFQPPTPPGQSAPQRPSLALLESVQAGRTSSALLSSIMGPAPGGPSVQSGAAAIDQSWTPNTQAGRAAYMMQGGLSQSQGGQWLEGANATREWFA